MDDNQMEELRCTKCSLGSVTTPKIIKKGPHYKAVCPNCGAYIKFLKASEVQKFNLESPEDPQEEILFKLDLILDHLGIKTA